MLSVDATIEPPTPAAIREMWDALDVQRVSPANAAVSTYLDAVQATHVNGGALLYGFSISPNTVFDWFGSHNRLDEVFLGFINLRVVRETAPELLKDASDPELQQKWGMPFILEGELTATLVSGGAYERFRGSPDEAKSLAASFCRVLLEDRYADVGIYWSCKPWSPWFFDVAWDYTYVVLDKRKRLLWLLAVTDTD